MLVLFDVALSPYAQKVKIALREKNLPFEIRITDLGAPDAEFLGISPRQEVPALKDGDQTIVDSTIILDYLEDKWPQPAFQPAAAAGRARARIIEEVCDTQFEAVNWAVTEVGFFKRASGDAAAAIFKNAAAQAGGLVRWLEARLGGAEWFGGARFDRADAAVFPHLNNAVLMKIGPAPGSPLERWRARCLERGSVRQMVAEAKAGMGRMKQLGEAVLSGKVRRQYRDHRLEWLMANGGAEIVAQGMQNGTIRFSEPVR